VIIDTDRLRDDSEYKEELRHRCETDHLFLADMVGWTSFIPSLHQPAVDLYFPKNKNLPIEQQHPIKNRLHLDPRHTFKTTLGKVDTLQWILAFPETITIVNESSTQPLAAAISTQIAKLLWKPSYKQATRLQMLYPELVDSSKIEPEGKWSTPNHSDLEMDSTLGFTSPMTAQSGWHPWCLNPDDMVDTTNSGVHATSTARKKVIDSYYTNKNTVRFGGYINIRGTRYHPFELYGQILETMDPAEWQVLIRGSMIVNNGLRLLPGDFPDEDEVTLVFPGLLDYKRLRGLFFEHYESFMSQQMNDPQGGAVPTFDEHLYTSILTTPDRITPLGETFICWRLPYGGKPYMATYAEGAAARVFAGKVYITDCWQGIYPPSRLVEKIVRECRKHQTNKVMIEQTPGAEHIEAGLKNESYRKNQSIKLQWLEYEEDDNKRKVRLQQLETMMRAGRIAISTLAAKATECRRQFLNFGLVEENGIVDCISRLSAKIPSTVMRDELEDEEIDLARRRREDMAYSMAFGQAEQDMLAGHAEMENRESMKANASRYAWDKANSFGLPPLPGGLDG
jgi:hypothetical protein